MVIPAPTHSKRLHSSHQSTSQANTAKVDQISMALAPKVKPTYQAKGGQANAMSDNVDNVNVMKGKQRGHDEVSKFDSKKDKAEFWQYMVTCDGVKIFYAVCCSSLRWYPADQTRITQEANTQVESRYPQEDSGKGECLFLHMGGNGDA